MWLIPNWGLAVATECRNVNHVLPRTCKCSAPRSRLQARFSDGGDRSGDDNNDVDDDYDDDGGGGDDDDDDDGWWW